MSRTAFERLRSNERFEALRLETLRLQQEARERAAREYEDRKSEALHAAVQRHWEGK